MRLSAVVFLAALTSWSDGVTGQDLQRRAADRMRALREEAEALATREKSLLVDLRRRYRDVKQGRDGLLYLLTDEADAVMLRIEPAE